MAAAKVKGRSQDFAVVNNFRIGDRVRRVGKKETGTATVVLPGRSRDVIVELDTGALTLHCSMPSYRLELVAGKELPAINKKEDP